MSLADRRRRLWAAARGDEESRYVLAERAAAWLHPDAVLSEKDRFWLSDTEFRRDYDRLDPHNRRRMDRAWNLKEFARATRSIEGDTAECGVFHGLTSYFICREIQGTGKTHHGFDSFEGLPAPGPDDAGYWAEGDLTASEQVARANLAPFDFVEIHRGWIPEHFGRVADRTFALVHIDVDLYEPTRDSLEFFLQRMSPGGMVVLDDYGFTTCPGATKAADEACAAAGYPVIALSSGQALVCP